MSEAHDALMCIGQKEFLDDKNRFRFSDQHYLKKSEDIKKLYQDLPEALENNYNFPLRFNFKPKKSKPILPSISSNKDNTAEKELMSQATQGLEERLNSFILKKNEKRNLQKKLEKFMKTDYVMKLIL